jgi:hypothetical protein
MKKSNLNVIKFQHNNQPFYMWIENITHLKSVLRGLANGYEVNYNEGF